jgi:alkylation response protein AidB-like acyl-CoA dehydrogenase
LVEADVEPEEPFRARAREFLAAHAPRRAGDGAPTPARASIAEATAFQRALAAAGLAGLTVPRRYGGAGLTARHVEWFNDEARDHVLPTALFTITLGMCVPMLLQFGTEEQRERHIGPMLRGEELWCQMFSEPEAGSDLASLRMAATRDGDEWVLDGQKIWTSTADHAQYGMCLARTDPSLPKHRGLSMFIVPMDTPGVEVRPLVLMTGDRGFNEVFCTGARLGADALLGEVNGGWRCAVAMLMNERVALGAGGSTITTGRAPVLIAAAQASGGNADPLLRQELASLWIGEAILGYIGERVRSAVQVGREPGPEGSIAKLAGSQVVAQAAAVATRVLGPPLAAWPLGDDAVERVKDVLAAPSISIAGGTSEIQRNIIGERVLGLPPEPKAIAQATSVASAPSSSAPS